MSGKLKVEGKVAYYYYYYHYVGSCKCINRQYTETGQKVLCVGAFTCTKSLPLGPSYLTCDCSHDLLSAFEWIKILLSLGGTSGLSHQWNNEKRLPDWKRKRERERERKEREKHQKVKVSVKSYNRSQADTVSQVKLILEIKSNIFQQMWLDSKTHEVITFPLVPFITGGPVWLKMKPIALMEVQVKLPSLLQMH